MNVLLMDPAAPVSNRVRARCPYCLDFSFWKEFQGTYSVGGIARPNPFDCRDEIPITRYVDDEWDGESVTYIMMLEEQHADPR